MASIFTGNGLGLYGNSFSTNFGNALLGRAGQSDRVYVNNTSGNLVIQAQDEYLASLGIDIGLVRTYNAQGEFTDDNGDNWRLNVHQRIYGLTGTVNTAGSSITKVFGDGHESLFTYDVTRGFYVSTEGAGPHDTLSYGEGLWIYTDGTDTAQELFDEQGRLINSRDADGNSLSYLYTGSLLTEICSASDESIFLDYSGTNLTQIRVVASGVTQTLTRYTYDTQNRLTEVRVDLSPQDDSIADGQAYLTTYTYDGSSTRIASITHADSSTVSFTYEEINGEHRVKTVTDGEGKVTTFTYVSATQTDVIDPLGFVTTYMTDATGRLTQVLSPDVGGVRLTTNYSYDVDGNLVSVTDPRGNVTAMAYDARGNLTLTRDALGSTVTRTYSASNQLLTETVYLVPDPDGAGSGQPSVPLTTRYAYDGENHLRFIVSAEGRVTEHRYAANGNRTSSITYADGTYDLASLTPTDTLNEAQLNTWVGSQNLSQTQRSDYAYDFRGQVSTTTTYAGVSASGEGIGDGTHSVTRFIYDQRGRLLQTIDARGESTSDPNDYVTSYTYDGLGRLLTTTQWVSITETRTTTTTYDDAGNRLLTSLQNGLTTTNVYDRRGFLVSVSQSATAQALGTTQYKYDTAGKLRLVIDPIGNKTHRLYDEAGRVIATLDATAAVTETVYDNAGNAIKTIRYANRPTPAQLSSLVDTSGNPTNVTLGAIRPPADLNNDRVTRTIYDNANRAVMEITTHDTDATQAYVTQTFYDGAGRLTDVIAYATAISLTGLPGALAPADVGARLTPSASDRHTRRFYDAEGKLIATLDAEGFLTESRYNAAGQLVETIGCATATDVGLRVNGTLSQLRASAGTHLDDQHTHRFHNAKGQVIAALDAEGYLTEYAYDAAGNQTESVRYYTRANAYSGTQTVAELRPSAHVNDQVTVSAYNGVNQVTEVTTNPSGTVTRYTYDSVGNLIRTDKAWNTAEVRTLRARYDLQGRLVQELTAEGAAVLEAALAQNPATDTEAIFLQYSLTHNYDRAGRRTYTLDQNGFITCFYYDQAGRLTHTINHWGEVSETRYNAFGDITDTLRYTARIWTAGVTGGTLTQELRDRLSESANAASDARTQTNYTLRGAVKEVIEWETASLSRSTRYSYDAFDLTVIDQPGSASARSLTSYYYDRTGRLLQTAEDINDGSGTGLERLSAQYYDAFGRLTRKTTASGTPDAQTTRFTYDRLGRQLTVTDPLTHTRGMTYDALGRVLTQTDARGHRTTFTHDDANRTLTITTPEGVQTVSTHNRHGETVAVGDGKGTLTTYTYDKNGNLTTTVVDDSAGGLNLTSAHTYDRANRRIESTDANGTRTVYTYDVADRVLSKTLDPTGLNLKTIYAYDGQGRTLTVTDGAGTPEERLTQYTYDRKGQTLSVLLDPAGLNLVTTYTYDPNGKTVTVTEGAGTPEARVTEYKYDNLGRLLSQHVDPVGLDITTTYTYDNNGNVVGKTDANGNVTRYVYDGADRLVFTIDPLGAVMRTDYDAEGRIVRVTSYANAINIAALPASPSIADVVIVPDATRDRVTASVYDGDGRERYSINALGAVTEKVYDANGNAIRTIVYATAIASNTLFTTADVQAALQSNAADQVTRVVYDTANRAIYTVDAAGAVMRTHYDANGNAIRSISYANTVAVVGDVTQAQLEALIMPSTTDHVFRRVYDAANRQTYAINAGNFVQGTRYDNVGRVTETREYTAAIDVGVFPTSSEMAAALNSIAAHINTFNYDHAGRLVLNRDPLGFSESYGYDAVGNKTSVTDKIGGISTYLYDAAGRRTFSIDALGYVTQRTYDGLSNVIKETSYANARQGTGSGAPQIVASASASGSYVIIDAARDRIVHSVYDAAGRMRYAIDGEGYVTERRFDTLGQETNRIRYAAGLEVGEGATVASITALLPATVPANAVHEQTRYDHLGRVAETVDGEGAVTRNLYDTFGRKTHVIRAYGTSAAVTTHYVHDILGQVVEEIQAYGSTDAASTRYALDTFGNRIRVVDPRGIELAEADSGWALAIRQTLGYVDGAGNALLAAALTGADKDALRAHYTTTQEFDALGRKTRSTDALGGVTEATYDAFGNAVKIIDPRGNAGYFYFNARKETVLHVDPEGYAVQTVYDGFGNVEKTVRYATKVTGSISTSQPPTIVADAARDQVTTTQYDNRGLKIKITDAENNYKQYTYDAFGGKLTYRNQLDGVISYVHDRVGNVVNESLPVGTIVNHYEYDTRGNLTKQIEAFGLPEQRVTQFEYDKLDRQVKKVGQAVHVFDPATLSTTTTASPVEQTRYDARGNVIETVAADGGRTLIYYDALDRKITQIDALGALTVWQYNDGKAPVAELRYGDPVALPSSAGGVPPAPLDPTNVRKKYFTYDANDALVEIRAPHVLLGEQAAGATSYGSFFQDVVSKSVYDAAGNEVQTIDGRGNSILRYYDRLGQKILEIDAERYVTRWERDAAGNIARETRYANRLTLAPGITTDVSAIVANVTGGAGDRVTEQDYDRLGRVVERRVLGVETGTVSAGGALTAIASAMARAQFQYNGLGQVTRQIDATGAAIDTSYDTTGRKVREQGAQFIDYEGALVRPTTDFEYDALNQLRRELVRGKNDATESDDRVAAFQYDYGFGARPLAQVDASGAATRFAYDVAGRVVSRWMSRHDADGAATTDRMNFSYDALGRQVWQQDAGTGQTQEARYNAYGELIGKRTNGGGAGAAWQEVIEYDALGRIWKSNTGDGVFKVYLHDASGNVTLAIQSAGSDFSGLTLDQVMALPGDQKYLTVSQYDARNQLIATYQPRMNATHDLASIEQFITQTAGVNFSGGAVAVGAIGQTYSKPKTDPIATGAVEVGPGGTVSYVTSGINARPLTFSGSVVPLYHADAINALVTLPSSFGELSSDNFRVSIHTDVWNGFGNAVTSYDATNFFDGNASSFTVQVSGSFTCTYSGSLPYGSFSTTISIYKQIPSLGERFIASGGASGLLGVSGGSWPTGTSVAAEHQVHFKGQSTSANRLILQYRPAGSNAGWSTMAVPQFSTMSSVVAGWFAFDWTGWARGTYDIRYVAVDAGGNILNSASGTMVLSDGGASINQTAQPFGGAGRAFLGADGKLNILEQGANAQTLIVRYRALGSTGDYLSSGPLGSVTVPGWFIFDTAGLSGSYEYYVEAWSTSGLQVNKAKGTFTVGDPNSVSALIAWADQPQMVHFTGQPARATGMKISYRLSGSTGAYATAWATKVGAGVFDWDATGLVLDRLANYEYGFKYETFDAADALVDLAHGMLRLGRDNNDVPQLHAGDLAPSLIRFKPPQTDAVKLVLHYRAGSSGPYTDATLMRASADDAFVWDVSAFVAAGTVVHFEYSYDLYTSGNSPILSAAGVPVHVVGAITAGAAVPETELRWIIAGASNLEWSVQRKQAHNAFGEISQEIDGNANVTNFRYNALGKLVEKKSPFTDVTLTNGFVQRDRPTTDYVYDLAGRLIGVRDANGNLNTQTLLAGAVDGGSAKVLTEFHADGGRKLVAYDVFGDARALTDEVNRVTVQEYDKLGRLTRVVHPARSDAGATGSAVDVYAYDELGNRIAHTDAQNKTEKAYYDSLGQIVRTTSYAGNATTYGYSYLADIVGAGGVRVGGWLKTTTDATGRTLADRQDIFGRVTWHKDLGDHQFSYSYNYAGWLTSQTGSTGQNIVYDYYANGYQKSIDDRGTGTFTKYEYDAEGNRTLETYSRDLGGGNREYYEYAEITYDELNRVKRVLDPKADMRYEYDANGNRRHVWSYYHDGINGFPRLQDFWYLYDSMNRFTLTMGQLSNSSVRGASAADTSVSIVKGTTGIEIGYDAASQRRTAVYGADGHSEAYTYTADGYLEDTRIDGVLRARRVNDTLGRMVQYQEYNASGAPTSGRQSAYNDDSQLLSQTEYTGAIGGVVASTTTYDYLDAAGTNNNAGALASTVSVGGGSTTSTYYTYEYWNSAKEKDITAQPYNPSAPGWRPGYSHFQYDLNGHLQQVDDPMGGRSIRYTNDARGQILNRTEIGGGVPGADGSVSGGTVDKRHSFYYLDGHRIGDVGNDGPLKVSYAEELARNRSISRKDSYRNWKPISSADFDQNFEPIGPNYPPTTSSVYTVRSGDTLQSIALTVWGDASLWYLIADANGLSGSTALVAGQTLTIPNKVTNIHNSSETYRVYNPGEAIGDTSPTLPEPPPAPMPSGGKKGCNTMVLIIVIVVMVVATILTAGAAAVAMGAASGSLWGAGVAAMSGSLVAGGTIAGVAVSATTAGMVAAGVGAAVGSIASQTVAIATGVQEKFSWSQVAVSALGSAASAGLGSLAGGQGVAGTVGLEKGGVAAVAVNAMASNAASQGVNMIFGQQKKFDWKGVAFAGASASAQNYLKTELKGTVIGNFFDNSDAQRPHAFSWEDVARQTASGIAKGAVTQALSNHGKVDWRKVGTNAFGNAIGNSLVNDATYTENEFIRQREEKNAALYRERFDKDTKRYNELKQQAELNSTDAEFMKRYERMRNGTLMVFMDGTRNDKDQPKLGSRTNVAELFDAADVNDKNKLYIRGVGTGDTKDQVIGGFTGNGAGEREELAFKWLGGRYNELIEQGYSSEEINISIVGFSRGAASSRNLANMINDMGFATSEANRSRYGDNFASPAIKSMVLFDTVASFGLPGNGINLGKKLDIPSNVQNAWQAVASDEVRVLFPLHHIGSSAEEGRRRSEMLYPGVHSDIGGGYTDTNKLSRLPLLGAWNELTGLGLPMRPLSESLMPSPVYARIDQITQRASGVAATHDSRYFPGVWVDAMKVLWGGQPARATY